MRVCVCVYIMRGDTRAKEIKDAYSGFPVRAPLPACVREPVAGREENSDWHCGIMWRAQMQARRK